MESRIIKTLTTLGIPGVAFGIFYLLLRQFGFTFSTIGPVASAAIAILFLLIVGGITLYALHRWAPSQLPQDKAKRPTTKKGNSREPSLQSPEVTSDWRSLTDIQRTRLKDALIAIGPHSILIEHNPNSDCLSFAYEVARVFKDSGWSLLRQPYPQLRPHNNLYFETRAGASEPISRLVFLMSDFGLTANASHDRHIDADVLLFVGPRRPSVALV